VGLAWCTQVSIVVGMIHVKTIQRQNQADPESSGYFVQRDGVDVGGPFKKRREAFDFEDMFTAREADSDGADQRSTAKCNKCFDTGTVYESHGEAVNCEAKGCDAADLESEPA
jgi:hypothetical protein